MASGAQENQTLGQLQLYLEGLSAKLTAIDALQAANTEIPSVKVRAVACDVQRAEEALKDLEALVTKRIASM